jgi:Domain of unknown function (DUF4386)
MAISHDDHLVTADRRTARIVGILYIAATLAGVLSVAILHSVVDADDYLVKASLDQRRVATGALFQLVMYGAIAGVAVAIYPVLKRQSERLALGFVVARSTEVMAFVVGTVLLLTLVTVSQAFVDAGAPSGSPHFQVLGDSLLGGRDWAGALGSTAFSVSALILNSVLYRARLLPRWLSLWGLLGAVLYLAASIAVVYGLEPASTTENALEAALGVQEMVFALWLIVKGFNRTALTAHATE